MKRIALSKYILSFLFLLAFITSMAQSAETPKTDDEFGVFLLVIGCVFMCAMFGAAIIGAMAASLVVFTLFALTALGILSTSIAVGLYRRSFSAGFKTFLVIVFGLTGAVLGIASAFVVTHYFVIPLASSIVSGIAVAGGAIGGVVMAFATYSVVQRVLQGMARRFKTAS